ncbi:unnamed protein product [Rhizoctonia solani]|uniref:Uncharacterized protein n=1 Tax=Rhizoctonia solani TaxID=456999 RepID=A0A8H2X334_9AGAM|nr:unnamed protein product [Rhizoctonia solani]
MLIPHGKEAQTPQFTARLAPEWRSTLFLQRVPPYSKACLGRVASAGPSQFRPAQRHPLENPGCLPANLCLTKRARLDTLLKIEEIVGIPLFLDLL